jgi:xanthine dehydrogenase small subunit
MAVRFLLNGKLTEARDDEPHASLLAYLRGAGLTGAKEGCAEGECGACAVALVHAEPGRRAQLIAVNSCLVPLGSLEGRALWTVEGVAAPDGSLHPVQSALAEAGGSQCGYCTPGFVMSLFCEYYREGRDEYDPEAISGNLCRCTGYRPIVEAARSLPRADGLERKRRLTQCPARDQADEFGSRADPRASTFGSQTDPRASTFGSQTDPRASTFGSQTDPRASTSERFLRPHSLAEACETLAQHPRARPLAGGTDLMVEANLHHARFAQLVSLENLPELQVFERGDDELVLGAALSLEQIAQRAHALPLFDQLLPSFASRLIRQRATLGGNLATASPIGDAAPVLLALDAQLELVGSEGARRLPLGEFFTGYRKTALEPGELIASVRVPLPAPRLTRFYKVSKRVLDDISTVAAAFALDLDARGQVVRLRAAYGGVAATPLRVHALEQLALGKPWTRETLALLLGALRGLGSPLSDARGSAGYRRALIEKLLEKFWSETCEELRARGPGEERA